MGRWRALAAPVDIASIAAFRVAFGAIMVWEVVRYFRYGWIDRYYIDPTYHFAYYGFGWVRPWPGEWMYVHFVVLGGLAACVMLGLWYRLASVLFFLAFTYVFLLDQTQYLNHFYLISLLAFLLAVIPAHRAGSVDARRRPALQSDTAPAWALWILRAQLGVVYLYGGIAKLDGDWLRGEPMRSWLAETTDFPLIGRFFTEVWAVWLFSYGGLLFDLLIVPALCWRRTRPVAFAAAVAFHLMNARLFSIGIFPWMMIAATLLFFPPDWPRRWLGWPASSGSRTAAVAPSGSPHPLLAAGLALFLALQLGVPLRHWLYPGSVSWTEDGHRFSWHMKLRDKDADAWFMVTDPATGRRWEVDPHDYLTARQAGKMASRPDMILQFGHHLADVWRARGVATVEVHADVWAALNDREWQPFIDPDIDLAAVPRTLGPTEWVVPLGPGPQAVPRPAEPDDDS